MLDASSIRDRKADILARMRDAAIAAGRAPDAVSLICVSKTQPDAMIEAMLATGQRIFGENRVQEARTRWQERRQERRQERSMAQADLALHLIGPLQTNKADDAVQLFDVIESVDRLKLARALADAIQKAGHAPEILVQVNTGEEPQKAGIAPQDVDGFLESLRRDYAMIPVGLMCIPPHNEHPAAHFALLAKLASRNGLARLSMGMSEDFEIAIRFGATHVRVGSALFGPREEPVPSRRGGVAPLSPKE